MPWQESIFSRNVELFSHCLHVNGKSVKVHKTFLELQRPTALHHLTKQLKKVGTFKIKKKIKKM